MNHATLFMSTDECWNDLPTDRVLQDRLWNSKYFDNNSMFFLWHVQTTDEFLHQRIAAWKKFDEYLSQKDCYKFYINTKQRYPPLVCDRHWSSGCITTEGNILANKSHLVLRLLCYHWWYYYRKQNKHVFKKRTARFTMSKYNHWTILILTVFLKSHIGNRPVCGVYFCWRHVLSGMTLSLYKNGFTDYADSIDSKTTKTSGGCNRSVSHWLEKNTSVLNNFHDVVCNAPIKSDTGTNTRAAVL